MKRIVSGIMPILLILGALTIAFNVPPMKADADPLISGNVRDTVGNPVPDVLIVAQDVTTEEDVASAISNATGAYSMTVPQGTYNLIVTPPPESGFAPTTISNIEITQDCVIDIVLVSVEELVNVSGVILDRDGNPVPNQWVYIGRSAVTDENGRFSINVPVGEYVIELCNWWSYAQNVPLYYHLYGKSTIKITEDASFTIVLQNRYISGKTINSEQNPISGVSINVQGYTDFGD
ncbi:MAG: carboxypeptidase-like regulatory domain-containing protein, partial [Candidatus Bathyarchaeia archaeon]